MHLTTLINKVSPDVTKIFSQFKRDSKSAIIVEFIHKHPGHTAKEIAKKYMHTDSFIKGILSRLYNHDIITASKDGREYRYTINKKRYEQIKAVAIVFDSISKTIK